MGLINQKEQGSIFNKHTDNCNLKKKSVKRNYSNHKYSQNWVIIKFCKNFKIILIKIQLTIHELREFVNHVIHKMKVRLHHSTLTGVAPQ